MCVLVKCDVILFGLGVFLP